MHFFAVPPAIIHIDLDTFFVSCERLLDPKLNGRPVLIGGTSDRGVVASCSYEAREYGIHSAMPMRMARQLCPHAVVIRGNAGTYAKFSDMVTEIIKERSPLFEKSSIDEFYIDVSGMDKFFGCYKWAQELREKIRRETHLPLSFGLSTNKTVSKITTGEAKPDNHKQIPKGMEKEFLAPLSVKKIPGVGDQTYKFLLELGVRTIGTLQNMSAEVMEQVLGKNGITLWKKANGIDNSPVIPFHDRRSISSSLTFERDTIDVESLRAILCAMAEKLCFCLRNGNKVTSCVTVTVRYSDFATHSKQEKIPHTSCDHILIKKTLELFNALYNRRVLCRLVGVRFSHLAEGAHQINLFDDSEEMIRLYQAMDRLRNRFGHDAVMRAVTMDVSGVGQMSNPF
ncbi:MAG TPA: DNA polymerase IV, partial [Bacteroidia bacterium]